MVAYLVKKNKCKLEHCFELHFETSEDLCLRCEEDSILQEEVNSDR